MSYSCVYEDTIFYDQKSKHSIIRVRTKDNSIPNKARKATSCDDFIRFVAKGYNLPQTSKISMVLDGEWETSKYGTQLNVETCEEIVPHTDEGMKGYLSSCLVKGIGAVTADEIIKRFGADTLNIIENEPERLLEIKGISEQKLEEIKRTFKLHLKSGYGFECNFDEYLFNVEGYESSSKNHATGNQYQYALFPEFNYEYGIDTSRYIEVDTNTGKSAFVNADGMERQHFTPIYYPDGEYKFKVVTSDCWTPAGMLKTYKNVTIHIDGNMYEDWYIAR